MASGNISVFCNKSVKFRHPKDREVVVVVRDHDFVTVPGWVVHTKLFEMLTKENSIKLINSSSDAKDIEMKGKVAKEDLDKFDKLEDEDGEVVDLYDGMTAKDLYNKCVEEGLDVSEKKPRKYYINKLSSPIVDPENSIEDDVEKDEPEEE